MNEYQIERTSTAEAVPALNLIFDGLFFVCFNTGGAVATNDPAGECRVGFVTTAPHHQITISGKQTTVVGGIEIIKTFQKVLTHAEARRMEIDIDVPGAPSTSVFRKGYNDGTFSRTPTATNQEYFKWLIDMENFELHNRKLTLIPNALKPVMHIRTGEFYTRKLSDVEYFRTKVDTEQANFGKVAAVIGVRMATLPQNKAFLKIGAATLELATAAGETWEVTFKNRCPKCDDERIGDPHLSDFPLHYHAFDVKALEQYDFDYCDIATAFPPAICYAVFGSQTTDI
jgi:hypothetical protein